VLLCTSAVHICSDSLGNCFTSIHLFCARLLSSGAVVVKTTASVLGPPVCLPALCLGACRSTELLTSVQHNMRYNASTGSFTADGLVAYVTASDAIRGQGWKARATLFMQLMAPRYTLLPIAHNSGLRQQMQLLALAAADLPAVGRMAAAEVGAAGARAAGVC
jgi:hypothetical protein